MMSVLGRGQIESILNPGDLDTVDGVEVRSSKDVELSVAMMVDNAANVRSRLEDHILRFIVQAVEGLADKAAYLPWSIVAGAPD